jgi:hypothetical protein
MMVKWLDNHTQASLDLILATSAEADSVGDEHIGSEHVLLAVLHRRSPAGPLVEALACDLEQFGITAAAVQRVLAARPAGTRGHRDTTSFDLPAKTTRVGDRESRIPARHVVVRHTSEYGACYLRLADLPHVVEPRDVVVDLIGQQGGEVPRILDDLGASSHQVLARLRR